ncbi:Maf family protein [Candidatus Endowatersipora endosymbiont of Watersipora subatra]|uniref:Maf family protein n=1 Tax=Candidatus Endowatersipora endosymbiont of Watersipora subatra TaxID=3077946 RepID=UPI00312C9472
MNRIILASLSPFRAQILHDAGLIFTQNPARLHEREIDLPLKKAGLLPKDRAIILAQAKAVEVSERHDDDWVIGCDQILSIDNIVLHKVKSLEDARTRLFYLSGKTHILYSAVVIARSGEKRWQYVSTSFMTMRHLSPQFIGNYLSLVGPEVLSSVGVYQIEGLGLQLFSDIRGDMFSIIGLPLLPLLEKLKSLNLIDDEVH